MLIMRITDIDDQTYFMEGHDEQDAYNGFGELIKIEFLYAILYVGKDTIDRRPK